MRGELFGGERRFSDDDAARLDSTISELRMSFF